MITVRAPSTQPTASALTISPPPLSWLSGAWHVTHSTLPMWKGNRNVVITYTPLPGGQIDDMVTYQALTSSKLKTVNGVDKPVAVEGAVVAAEINNDNEASASLAYHWRGKGWLAIASSKWEILAWGDEEGGNQYVVTYFAKTLFTPAGVDYYSRKGALRPETLEGIKSGLAALEGDIKTLAGEIFEVKMDAEVTH